MRRCSSVADFMENYNELGTSALAQYIMQLAPNVPGTEFWDAETGRQKSSRKSVNPCRDQSPGSKRPEIPAEAPYLASTREAVVCGDWMVVCAVTREPVSASHPLLFPVICIFQGS